MTAGCRRERRIRGPAQETIREPLAPTGLPEIEPGRGATSAFVFQRIRHQPRRPDSGTVGIDAMFGTENARGAWNRCEMNHP